MAGLHGEGGGGTDSGGRVCCPALPCALPSVRPRHPHSLGDAHAHDLPVACPT
ncbi:hypothetical protein E2C01_073675 [Portunus trituberculatus]|uniref:Uncharacterized protein n=1 Tax=Portunus trituberculatus TaxID=210409 RepID=A0A5B7I5Z4_PORTR|nr:hypothetical protein [Portunus trituberculatus]